MDPISFDFAFWSTCGAIAFLLFLSGIFSGSETALTAASRGKLRAKADKGSIGAKRALAITNDTERLIGSILLGNNLVNILAASLATALFTRELGDNAVALATLVMTLLILIFAEVLPKTYAITNPEKAAIGAAVIMRPLITVFAPIVAAVRWLVRAILWVFRVQTDPDGRLLAVREEIAGAISLGHDAGSVEKDDRDRILGALDLSERTIDEVMLHRSEIEMIDASLPPQEILEIVLGSAHTRLPMYKNNPENIVGILHAKDLLRAMYSHTTSVSTDGAELSDFDVLEVARKPYFAPETTPLDDQMRQFLRQHTHFALVVDEYGVLQGLVTLEDILEEIVGEITDEFDTDASQAPVHLETDDWLVDGATTIRDLNRAADLNLPDEEANTIAGLVIHEAQTIPTVGQVFLFHGVRFEILERKSNRISRLKIRRT
ncbi:MAG: HlyC/CorC family transporter [Paracoccaceae bacterium]